MKTCFKCGIEKQRSEFYPHKQMADGLLGKCKACTILDSTLRRAKKIDQVQEYDRMRSKLPHRKNARSEWHRTAGKTTHKHKRHAESAAAYALRCGKIKRESCKDCGESGDDMHHEDYSKPTEIVWLCVKCHHARHTKYDYAETLKTGQLVRAE